MSYVSTESSGGSNFWATFFESQRLLSGTIIILIYILLLSIFAYLISGYIAKLYRGEKTWLDPVSGRLVNFFINMFGEDARKDTKMKEYFITLIVFNAAAGIIAFVFFFFQSYIPFAGITHNYSFSLSFNTVTSFLTNTNLQHYSDPLHLSYLSKTFVLTGLMFLSASTGFAVSMAFIRGILNENGRIGNFYRDFLVSVFYLIFPLTILVTIIFILSGVPQDLSQYVNVNPILSGGIQRLPLGPVATWEAIKNIGTNGGGFYGSNAAMPLENPNWFTNLVEFLSFTVIPLGSILSLGKVFNNRGFARTLYVVLISIFFFTTFMTFFAEYSGIPSITSLGTIFTGNMLGKETAIGISQTSIFSSGAVFTSTGAADSVLLAFTPAGLLGLMGNLILNDPLGGVGTGVLNIFMYVIFAIFITSLMVGKLPEIMSIKISSKEIKYSTLSLVTHPLLVLIPFGITMLLPALVIGDPNPRPDVISSVLYEFLSAASNNGSEVGGFVTNTAFFNITDGILMLLGRFVLMGLQLAIAQSFATKSPKVETGRTIETGSPLFALMLFVTIIMLGVLSFFPVLALGPFLSWAKDFNLFIGGML